MTTSGVTTDGLTALDLIAGAFGKLNLIVAGEPPSDDMAEPALSVLNLMIKSWAALPHLWLITEGSQALTVSQASYVLDAGTRKLLSVRRRTGNIDLALTELSREDYFNLPNKSSAGLPINWFQDRQRGAVTLYVWLTPDAAAAAGTTLQYTYARQIQVFSALTDTADLPDEWQEAIVYNLAERLIPEYGADPQAAAEIRAKADGLMASLQSQDQEEASLFFQPAGPFG